jgi:hypothetical protein
MADLKISQMTAANLPLAGSETLPLIQGGNNRAVSVDNIRDGLVESDVTGITGADVINNIVSLTQAEYDAIAAPNVATVYVILG